MQSLSTEAPPPEANKCKVIGIQIDPTAASRARLAMLMDRPGARVRVVHNRSAA